MVIQKSESKIHIGVSTIILLFAAVFLVSKTYRGFSGSTTVGGIWNYIQLLFVLLGLIYLFVYSRQFLSNKVIRIFLLLSLYSLLSALINIKSISIDSLYNLAMTVYAVSVLILFYQLGKSLDISKRTILMPAFFITAFIVVSAIIQFLGNRRYWADRGAVADVYYVLGLLPLMMIYFKDNKAIIPIIAAALAVAFTAKRAGIIAIVFMIISYYLIKGSQNNSLKRHVRYLVFLILVLAVVTGGAIYLDNRLGLRLVTRLMRLSEDGGSGRDIRWRLILESIFHANPFQIILGHGNGSILASFGVHAHNDFIELFYENGIIGAAMYVLFYIRLIIIDIRMIRRKYAYAAQFTAALICAFTLSMFSFYFIDPTYITCGMICIGLILGDYESDRYLSAA